ncbi:MAG: C4-type zinc ribbon domain-containing protein [Desulfocapsaceae bacterium]|nr:C4-type zinc ribbon domain-containing protein [Desulfocapsaceae bacterium]
MNEVIAQLISLQQIDLQLDTIDNAIKQEQDNVDQQGAMLSQRESDIEDLHEQVNALENERRTLDLEMSEELAHVKSRQSKMMQVQTGREQTAILKEIEDGKRNIKEKEDKIVAIMEEVESLTAQIARQKELLEEETKNLAAETSKARETIKEINKNKQEQDVKRKKHAKEVEEKLLNKYNILRERRNGLAVVSVIQGVCQGCFMSIPPQQFNTLLRGDRHLDCPICQRIMYYQAPEDQE